MKAMAHDIERRVAELVGKLPTLPDTLDRLMNNLRHPAADDLADLAVRDPGLCLELLRLANTCGGTAGKVETAADALRSVGPETFAQYAGVSFANGVIQKEFADLHHLPQYFAHSREIALTCRALAAVAGLPGHKRDLYTVAGLIHDIGRLVMLIATDDLGAHLMGTSADQMIRIVQDEARLAGLNHCEIGQQICSQWNFSPVLTEGVRRHHTPLAQNDFSPPGAYIFLAHFVGSSDFTGEILAGIIPESLFRRLGVEAGAIEEARRLYQRYLNQP